MAWIFSLWVEAEKESERKAIKEYFNGKIIFANEKEYTVSAYESGMVTVDGISRVGICSQSDADEMTALGFEFYQLLKNAPAFRYAMASVEVDGFATIDEFRTDPEFYLEFKGFVICKNLYEAIKGEQNMQSFSETHLWTPYKGETWKGIE